MSENAKPDSANTAPSWDELILDVVVRRQVEEIATWIRHNEPLHEHRHAKTGAGYRFLFLGPPGPTKRLAIAWLARASGRAVHRVDLADVLAKQDDALAKLFEAAVDGILVLDEADALFETRAGGARDDRAANQQTAHLLQRLENYPGVVIVVMSNVQAHLDEVFARRFQSAILFAQE